MTYRFHFLSFSLPTFFVTYLIELLELEILSFYLEKTVSWLW